MLASFGYGLPLCGVRARLSAASSKLLPSPDAASGFLSDVSNDLGEIRYSRLFDFDSEIHFGISARISSIDLLSSG